MFLFSSVQNVKTFLRVTFPGLSNRLNCVSHLSCWTSYVASQFVLHPLQCEHKPGHIEGISKSTGHKCIKGESVWRPLWMSVVITGGTIILLFMSLLMSFVPHNSGIPKRTQVPLLVGLLLLLGTMETNRISGEEHFLWLPPV